MTNTKKKQWKKSLQFTRTGLDLNINIKMFIVSQNLNGASF